MIKLEVDYYCQNCPYFEPTTRVFKTLDNSYISTIVTCSDSNKCARIHNRIKEELDDLEGDDI